MRNIHFKVFTIGLLFSLASTTSTYGTPGERYHIKEDGTSVYELPSASAPVVRRLNMGDRVIEFRRQESWVKVSQLGAVGKDGWVEISHLDPDPPYYALYLENLRQMQRQREIEERQREIIEQQQREWEKQQREWAMQIEWAERLQRELGRMPQYDVIGLGVNHIYQDDAMFDVSQCKRETEILDSIFDELAVNWTTYKPKQTFPF